MREFLRQLYLTLRHLSPDALNKFVTDVGPAKFYAVIFAIIFCETGLVVTPFLPGDSLLFAIGAVGAHPDSPFHLPLMGAMVVLAALLGDNTNYWLGRRLGPAVFTKENSKLLNKKHLLKAQHFYDKYGSKTIILARFVPIVRTFAPFVAGIGRMNYFRFLLFSIIGATAWVSICLIAGYFLGSRDWVQKHFEIVVLAVIVVSLVPILVEYLKHRGAIRRRGFAVVEAVKQ